MVSRVHNGTGEGMLRPPSEPPASRAAAGSTGRTGAHPRTLAPARSWRSGAPVWSPAFQRPTRPPSARRRPVAPQTSGERASEVVSGLGKRWLDALVRIEGTTRRPEMSPTAGSTRPGAASKPSRRDPSRRTARAFRSETNRVSSLARLVSRVPRRSRCSRHFLHRLSRPRLPRMADARPARVQAEVAVNPLPHRDTTKWPQFQPIVADPHTDPL